jgi:hypothetical protein
MSKLEPDPTKQHRRALATAMVAGLLAVAFYVGFILFVHWTRQP